MLLKIMTRWAYKKGIKDCLKIINRDITEAETIRNLAIKNSVIKRMSDLQIKIKKLIIK